MTQGSLHIDGQWRAGTGTSFMSLDAATGAVVWTGHAAGGDDVAAACQAARRAFPAWRDTPFEERVARLQAYTESLRGGRSSLAQAISGEVGKPLWESLAEVDAALGKTALSIEAFRRRCAGEERQQGGATLATRYRPHGVAAVFGPYNLPAHLPNGHIVPALLAGNTVVFKPSELTPRVGQAMAEHWHGTGLPAGVLNLVQGGRGTGEALADPAMVDAVYFTGSHAVGCAINRRFADHPGRILALELGGNNPLVVHRVADIRTAAYITIQSAFITSGQHALPRGRLIVPRGSDGDRFVTELTGMMATIEVGPHTRRPEPFMGPVIHSAAADRLLAAQDDLRRKGGVPLVAMARLGPAMLSPGLIDVTGVQPRDDAEMFGPLLRLVRVSDFDAALAEADATRFGLAAGLLCDDAGHWRRFCREVRAGVMSWNRPTTGASGAAPFGGVRDSGSHRPAGFFSADYCSHPVASIEAPRLAMPENRPPGITA